jgi:hypothetical protein
MYNADGVGLAAPQVGLKDRIFVVDLTVLAEDDPEFEGFKKVFINAHILERTGDIELIDEGCLSLPGIHEKVPRENRIRIQYLDENLFKSFEFGIVFCQNGKIDNKDTVFKANLRRSQSNTIGIVHRLKHDDGCFALRTKC